MEMEAMIQKRRETRAKTLLCRPLTYERVFGALEEEYADAESDFGPCFVRDLRRMVGLSETATLDDVILKVAELKEDAWKYQQLQK